MHSRRRRRTIRHRRQRRAVECAPVRGTELARRRDPPVDVITWRHRHRRLLDDVRSANPGFPSQGRKDGDRTVYLWLDCTYEFDDSGKLVEIAPGDPPGSAGTTIDGVTKGTPGRGRSSFTASRGRTPTESRPSPPTRRRYRLPTRLRGRQLDRGRHGHDGRAVRLPAGEEADLGELRKRNRDRQGDRGGQAGVTDQRIHASALPHRYLHRRNAVLRARTRRDHSGRVSLRDHRRCVGGMLAGSV